MNYPLAHYLCPLMLCLYLTACGSGSSSNQEVAGIDGSGAPATSTVGTIDGFGSVIVNGVRYDSSNAIIRINNQVGIEDDLRTGYRVRITGTTQDSDSGIADTIEFFPDLVGVITQIDLVNKQLQVLNQQVQITHATIFDGEISPNSLAGLSLGERVLISGQTDNNGVLAATRIERTQQNYQVGQIGGVIHDLDESNHTFGIRTLTVDYSAATLENIRNGRLANGMRINIRGSADTETLIHAQVISGVSDHFESGIQKAEVEGFITQFDTGTRFEINGIPCSTTAQTQYLYGTQAQLALGAAVEIKGSVNSQGILVADKVEFERQLNNHIEGQVTQVTLNTTGAIVTGSLQIGGTSIQTTAMTRYEDKDHSQMRRFNISAIQTGDFLTVTGFNDDGVFIATKIERKRPNNNDEQTIEGIISQVDTQGFVILGQAIALTEHTDIRQRDNKPLSPHEFLAMALGLQVEVEGFMQDGVFIATEIEIEHFMQDFHPKR